jgi:hypothetical protein
MGWFKKAFKKVAKVATFGAYQGGGSGGGVVEAPAPEITLNQKDEGEAKEKVENAKLKARKGKKALKISKDEAPATGVGRNIV